MGIFFSKTQLVYSYKSECTMENADICPYSKNRIGQTIVEQARKRQQLIDSHL